MTVVTSGAHEVAQRIWTHALAESAPGTPAVLISHRLLSEYRAGLGRWIGAEGYRVLLDRALDAAETEHPVLGHLPFLGGDEPTNTEEAASNNDAVAAGMVALLVEMMAALGRIIGHDMAQRLLEQIGLPGARDDTSSAERFTTEEPCDV